MQKYCINQKCIKYKYTNHIDKFHIFTYFYYGLFDTFLIRYFYVSIIRIKCIKNTLFLDTELCNFPYLHVFFLRFIWYVFDTYLIRKNNVSKTYQKRIKIFHRDGWKKGSHSVRLYRGKSSLRLIWSLEVVCRLVRKFCVPWYSRISR